MYHKNQTTILNESEKIMFLYSYNYASWSLIFLSELIYFSYNLKEFVDDVILVLIRKEFQEEKMTTLLMGKLKKDMEFLGNDILVA